MSRAEQRRQERAWVNRCPQPEKPFRAVAARCVSELSAIARAAHLKCQGLDEDDWVSFLDPAVLPRVKAIGETLAINGGRGAMLWVSFEVLDRRWGWMGRELDYAWDGIGGWLA